MLGTMLYALLINSGSAGLLYYIVRKKPYFVFEDGKADDGDSGEHEEGKAEEVSDESEEKSEELSENKDDDDDDDDDDEDTSEDRVGRASLKEVIIFGALALCFNLVLAYFLCRHYPGNYVFCGKTLAIFSILWPAAFVDFKVYRIPNELVLYGLGLRAAVFIYQLIFDFSHLRETMVEDIGAGAILLVASLICVFIMRNSIGAGDIKLFVVIGLCLGLSNIFSAVFFSLVASFFVALFVLITKRKSRKDTIPFGPAIAIGTYTSIILTLF